MADGYPTVPDERLAEGGWAERVRAESTVFQTPTARIVGRTVLYDDRALRDALEAAGFGDLLAGRAESSGRRLVETGADGGTGDFSSRRRCRSARRLPQVSARPRCSRPS
ncbi:MULTISPECIES: hypothetical protein [Haloarcula]|uniref:hypothetical protein n=1 Tax=Haloarcula TaxID=2237 RepID=UPI0023E855FB|nr:hypothetical protein [Halomicroarcula sp. SHR3]